VLGLHLFRCVVFGVWYCVEVICIGLSGCWCVALCCSYLYCVMWLMVCVIVLGSFGLCYVIVGLWNCGWVICIVLCRCCCVVLCWESSVLECVFAGL